MATQTTEIGTFGRNARLVEVLFSDDTLVTVSRDTSGEYHVSGGQASSSVGYSSMFDPSDPYFLAAVEIARVHI